MKRAVLLLGFVLSGLLLAGCQDQSMQVQPKFRTYRSSAIWADGTSARTPPDHTVARGDLARDRAEATPPPVDQALLDRGQQRYDIYCQPCHGLTGHGDGMIVQRGFPAPPDYDSPRLLASSADHFYDVITDGYGVMYSYAARVEPADRWAIIAYIRALQTRDGRQAAATPGPKGQRP